MGTRRTLLRICFSLCSTSLLLLAGNPPYARSESLQPSDPVSELYAHYDDDLLYFLAKVVSATGKEVMTFEPISSLYTTPKKARIQGTPYDLGSVIGHIAWQAGAALPLRSAQDADLQRRIVEMYQRIYPQYLETLRGIGDVYGTEVDQLDMVQMEYEFFVGLWTRLLKYASFASLTDFDAVLETAAPEQCSLISYRLGNRLLIGRNWDSTSDRPHYFTSTKISGCYQVMGHAVYDLYYWVADGINEKGLSISQASNGGEYFWQDPYPEEPAVFSSRMARLVMDTCADVDEALRLIGSVRIWFPNQGLHWLLADAKGRSVVVEFDLNRKMVVFDREDPYELVTNTALQKGEEYILKNCWRYRTAKTMLEAGIQGTGDIGSIMTAIRPTTGGSRTVWTCLMDLQARSFEAYYFKEFDRKYEFRHPFRLWLPIVASPAGMQFSDDRQSPWSTDHNHRRRESP